MEFGVRFLVVAALPRVLPRIALLLSLLAASCSGCDDHECKLALDVVCGCGTGPCDTSPPHATAALLQRCKSDEVVGARGYHLAVCIEEAGATYCRILDALATENPALCDLTCNLQSACDLEQACHAFQFSRCDVPAPRDAGGPDGS